MSAIGAVRSIERCRLGPFELQPDKGRLLKDGATVSRDEAARELVRAQRDREIAKARLQRLLHRDVTVEPSIEDAKKKGRLQGFVSFPADEIPSAQRASTRDSRTTGPPFC